MGSIHCYMHGGRLWGGVLSTAAPGKVLKIVTFVVGDFFAQFGVWTHNLAIAV